MSASLVRCALQPNASLDSPLFEATLPRSRPTPLLSSAQETERFHWRPALFQSLEFLVFEHAFRLANDPYARYLLLHKPFWHDYLASANHFDMSRWGDGDNFLVNYIGHPLEGAVAGNIQIQNDPAGRALKFSKSSTYWKSRLKAMAWAAAYSAYFEIGPVLSEAALGNEGGYTYVPGCGFYPCSKPGQQFKSATDNTGWVDFVVTPVVGIGWIVLEDSIEANVVDRLAKNDRSMRFQILRAVLSPSRSMSNMLAGKYPWYRYMEPERREIALSPVSGNQKYSEGIPQRRSLGIQYVNLSIPVGSQGCSRCRVNASGVGLTFAYRLTRLFTLDSQLNFFPGSGLGAHSAGVEQFMAGLRIGHTHRAWGLFTNLRPGMLRYNDVLLPGSSKFEPVNRFAMNLSEAVEYYPSRYSAIRFEVGTTFVRYLTNRSDPRQPAVSALSRDYIVTQGNFYVTTGYTFRF